jgi:hypothetical protein
VCEQAALGIVEREPGFVARAFDAENEHGGISERGGECPMANSSAAAARNAWKT